MLLLLLCSLPLMRFVAADILLPEERRAMEEFHVQLRENVEPPASNMLLMMVWKEATEFGCATKYCKTHYFTMCLYRPAHNWPRERPYATGVSCSECPDGYGCYRNQCDASTEPVTDDFEAEPQNERPTMAYEAPHDQKNNLTSADEHQAPTPNSFVAEPQNQPITTLHEASIDQDDNTTSASKMLSSTGILLSAVFLVQCTV
uniref:SCP domain-containing protein n=1 Tax=Mesocestoides corti TaxID=53468 RepID=A0A5K3FJT6_MESCO